MRCTPRSSLSARRPTSAGSVLRTCLLWGALVLLLLGALTWYQLAREPQLEDWLEDRIERLHAVPEGASWPTGEKGHLFETLRKSECLLRQLYADSTDRTPPDCDSEGGHPPLGAALYWLNHPPGGFEGRMVEAMVHALERLEGEPLPSTEISPELYAAIAALATGQGMVDAEGTIYGEHTYEQLEVRWTLALLYYLYYRIEPGKIHPFGTTPQIIEVPRERSSITIAIVGDWGTGTYGEGGGPAGSVMNDVVGLAPDYIIHIGDVYYAGSAGFEVGGRRFFSEEYENLVAPWPEKWGAGTGTSFTLNSNHEMYDGANGYFDVALGPDTPFTHQRETSYFALTFGEWAIVGLDSSYHSDPKKLFLEGSLDGAQGEQARWIQEHFGDRQGEHIIALTHHNGLEYTGKEHTALWDEVCGAFGGEGPAYWYWGHVHDAAVYTERSATGSGVKGRLVGHGAMPFARSSELAKRQQEGAVDYFAGTPIAKGEVRVRNGFATITLTPDGGITERFYESTGAPAGPELVWSSAN